MIYFTADLHLEHSNIIKYCNRPYYDIDTMNKALINNWNSVVTKDDMVFVVGDFSFGNPYKYTDILNGVIAIIKGNHDIDSSFDSLSVISNSIRLFIRHIPYSSRIPDGTDIIVCGHVHEKWRSKLYIGIPMINVGVDVWDYKPISLDTLVNEANKLKEGKYNERVS